MQPTYSVEQLHTLLQQASNHLQERSFDTAQTLLDQASRMAPHVRDVLMLQAILAIQTRQNEKAEQIFRTLLRRSNTDIDALANLGFLLLQSERYEEALALFDRAIYLQPTHAGLHLNRGVTLQALERHDEALASYQRSQELNPHDAQAHFVTGRLHQDLQNFPEAFASYSQALSVQPTHPEALSCLLFTHHYLEDFTAHDHSRLARQLAQTAFPTPPSEQAAVRAPRSPLKVGFVSSDLREHPVGFFLETTLQQIDRTRLCLVAYSNNIFEDEVSERLKSHFTHWRVIESLNDRDAAALIRQDDIDVLIDLSGYTAGHRQSLFALRPAPLQLSWLGYFSTTGQTAIDYVLADPHCVPPEEEAFFSEKIWRLPTTRYCFGAPPDAPAVSELPVSQRGTITFGSFQALGKINDRVLRAWIEILQQAPHARLRLQSKLFDSPQNLEKFQKRLTTLSAPLERIATVGGQIRAEYLASYSEVDLLLDTFPYPGGTTTAEAL